MSKKQKGNNVEKRDLEEGYFLVFKQLFAIFDKGLKNSFLEESIPTGAKPCDLLKKLIKK